MTFPVIAETTFNLAKKGDEECTLEILKSFSGYIDWCASDKTRKENLLEDIRQESFLALLIAINDSKTIEEFKVFANLLINSAISRVILDDRSLGTGSADEVIRIDEPILEESVMDVKNVDVNELEELVDNKEEETVEAQEKEPVNEEVTKEDNLVEDESVIDFAQIAEQKGLKINKEKKLILDMEKFKPTRTAIDACEAINELARTFNPCQIMYTNGTISCIDEAEVRIGGSYSTMLLTLRRSNDPRSERYNTISIPVDHETSEMKELVLERKRTKIGYTGVLHNIRQLKNGAPADGDWGAM